MSWGITLSSRSTLICTPGLPWPPSLPSPCWNHPFWNTPPSLPCPPCSVHDSQEPRKTRPQASSPSRTHRPGHHTRGSGPRLHHQAPSTSTCPLPPLVSSQAASVAPHTKTLTRFSLRNRQHSGCFPVNDTPPITSLLYSQKSRGPSWPPPSPLPLSPQSRPLLLVS